jgi:hypothetical protein
VGAELFHADGRTDGRTDMTKLIVAFRNFAKAPKNALSPHIISVFPVIVTINGDSFPVQR